jgi:Fe-S-cluster containining protein
MTALPVATAGGPLPVHMLTPWYGLTPCKPLTPEIVAELEAYLVKFRQEGCPVGPCIWFDAATKQCRHYEYRPDLCRDEIMPGDDECRLWRQEEGIDKSKKFTIKNGKLVQTQ